MRRSVFDPALRSRSLRRLGVVAACLSLLVAAPVGAAGPTGQWGSVGEHRLRATPGACRYVTTGSGETELMALRRIVVKAPVAFARSGSQMIGWRTRIQARLLGAGDWTTVIARPVQRASATTGTAAGFTAQTIGDGSAGYWLDFEGDEFRALVDIIWYRDGAPTGGATLRAKPMAVTYDGTPSGSSATCMLGFN